MQLHFLLRIQYKARGSQALTVTCLRTISLRLRCQASHVSIKSETPQTVTPLLLFHVSKTLMKMGVGCLGSDSRRQNL